MTTLTDEQHDALQAFANRFGANWKERLSDYWMNGRDASEPKGNYLRQVRNQLGPTWLHDDCTILPGAPLRSEYRHEIPAWEFASWEGDKLTNAAGVALWSGKGPPPPVGSEIVCSDRKGTRCTITGYVVEGRWLMAEGFRTLEPQAKGNLAGAEIHYPEA